MGALSRIFRRAILLPVLLLAALSTNAIAQQKAVSAEDLARHADLVVVGRVADMKSEWAEGKTRIVTRVTLDVREHLKAGNTASKTVTIWTLGGEIGEVGELYTHVPTFQPNENVVVFLQKYGSQDYVVAAGTQGKYNIERDPVSGETVVAGKQSLEEFRVAVKRAIQ
jgi:hypothetical protein